MEFKIREAREAANLSQRELAKLLGIAPATLHGYETGKLVFASIWLGWPQRRKIRWTSFLP